MELDLLANGIDSLRHGLEHYADGTADTRNYKYAIVHVCHAAEMLLKERLEREHPSLLYRNVDVVQGKTVGYEQAIDRLEHAAEITISTEDKKRLLNLRDARNNVEHYKISLDHKQASLIIGDALAFLKKWLETELDVDLHDELDDSLWSELLGIEEIYQEHLKRVTEEINAIVYSSKGTEDVYFCPECMTESVLADPEDERGLKCLMCGATFYEVSCVRCDQRMPAYEQKDFVMCDSCEAWLERQ